MNRLIIRNVLFILLLAIFAYSENRTTPVVEPLYRTPITAQTYSGNFTYNPLRHAGHYIGHLDEENTPFSITLGAEGMPDSISALMAPYLSVSKPDKNFFDIYYAPMIISNTTLSPTNEISQNLHRFGLGIAFQTDDGFFRMSFNGEGYAGSSTFSNNDEERLILGVEEFGINFGWRIEDMLTLNISTMANGFMDTLTQVSSGTDKDRFSQITLPQVNIGAYITNDDLPYRMGFDIGYGRKHFVYSTTNPGLLRSDPTSGNIENADAVVTDSLSWDMMHQGDIHIAEKALIQPSIHLAQTLAWNKRMNPGEDNYPFNYNGEVAGSQWSEFNFTLGGGLSFSYLEFINYWLEFDRTSFNATEATVGIDMNGNTHTAAYNRFATGTTFSPSALPNVDFNGVALNFDLSFARTYQRTSEYSSYQYHVNNNTSHTQDGRYTLDINGVNGAYVFNDFTLGIRSSFIDNTLGLDLLLGVLKETSYNVTDESDIYLGVNLTYNLTKK